MPAAVVPVKSLAAGKTRLAAALGRERAEALALAMLEDLLAALGRVPRLDTVAVVTPDADVAEAATRAGARALLGEDPGLDASLARAARELAPACADGLLVVLGDVAGARAEELERLLDALGTGPPPRAALAPSSDGGTAALARRPPDAFPSRFGPDSARRHREAAAAAGVPLAELALPSLALDLDDEADLRAFLTGPGDGPRTRALLAELGVRPAGAPPGSSGEGAAPGAREQAAARGGPRREGS
jgi:2-phospho-L-lactate guanylyltransferase